METERVLLRTRCGAERETRVDRRAWEWLVPLTPDWCSMRLCVDDEPYPTIVRDTVRTFRRTRKRAVTVWGDILSVFEEVGD